MTAIVEYMDIDQAGGQVFVIRGLLDDPDAWSDPQSPSSDRAPSGHSGESSKLPDRTSHPWPVSNLTGGMFQGSLMSFWESA